MYCFRIEYPFVIKNETISDEKILEHVKIDEMRDMEKQIYYSRIFTA